MAALTWIISVLCAAAAAPSSAQVVQVVQPGQNVSLSCNFTTSNTITWYRLRSDQLLPLLTVEWSAIKGQVGNFHNADGARFVSKGRLKDGEVVLEILQAEEEDSGIYFCSWKLNGNISINRGIHLTVHGGPSAGSERGGSAGLPCWTLGVCVLPALLVSCVVFIVGLCVCSGKQASACCCRANDSLRMAEDAALHYSSLRHAKQLSDQGGGGGGGGGTGLVKEEVTYSTVAGCRTPHRSHDRR